MLAGFSVVIRYLLTAIGAVVFLTAPVIANEISSDHRSVVPSRIEIEVQHKTVGDKVAYSPNLPDGTNAPPSQRSRFGEDTAAMVWNFSDRFSIDGSLSQRRFVTLRDDFEFNASRIGLQYRLAAGVHSSTFLTFDISSNRSKELRKNSYTTIENSVIKEVSVRRPRDLQWNLGLKKEYQFGAGIRLSMSGLVGRTDSRHSGIEGEIAQGGCNYGFDFGNSGGEVSQIGQCGSLLEVTRIYPTDSTVESEFNVSPVLDFQNKSDFVGVGAAALKELGSWELGAEFYYQRYFRDSLDERITAAGGQAHRGVYTFTTTATYSFTPNLSITAMAEYHSNRYINQVPVLYTTITSSRFDEDAVFLSLGAKYKFQL